MYRAYLPILCRYLSTILVVLWALPFLATVGPGRFARATHAATVDAPIVCHCLHCKGGMLCCCRHARTRGDSLILRAACDGGSTQPSPPPPMPDAAFFAFPIVPAVGSVATAAFPLPRTDAAITLPALPLNPPPQFS